MGIAQSAKYVNPIPKTDVVTTARQCWIEGLGTFAICYIGGLAIMNNDVGKIPLLSVALAHTFVISFFVWAAGGISGGHFNGAVS